MTDDRMMDKLRGAPFYLDDSGIEFVTKTLAGMTDDDKLRQLFCLITYSSDEDFCRHIAKDVRPGGYMSRTMTTDDCLKTAEYMQKYSDIPMLVAANLESGGTGVTSDGTTLGKPMAVAATNEAKYARRLGEVCGAEGSAVGVNLAFSPVVDIDYNWRNPITNTRTFGSDPARVASMGRAFIKEIQKHGVAATAKHFPGDGRDERDQHISPSVNDLSVENWDKTYGSVYRAAITAGTKAVMIGHIMLPSYERYFSPCIRDDEIMPASVSYNIVTRLLKERLGFGGLVITDSSTMAGITAMLPRNKLVPMTIAAGCDMFLFTKDLDEDMTAMRRGYEDGIITKERLDDAVTHILALKASLGLHEKKKAGTLVPQSETAKKIIGQRKFRRWSRETADASVTLVKAEEGVLPLCPARYKRVLFCPIEKRTDGASIFASTDSQNGKLRDALIKEGFSVDEFKAPEGLEGMMQPAAEVTGKYDLIIYCTSLATKSNQTTVRIEWANPMGANVPVYVHSVPTVFVSLENPYHMIDVPQVKTFINCYGGSDEVIKALVEKLCGRSDFRGRSPVDPYAYKKQTNGSLY